MITEFDPNVRINVTPSAIEKIKSLLKQDEYLRLYIAGGGCSGFQYMFDIVKEREEEDIQIPNSRILIDPMSYQYVENSEIDYETGLIGSKFMVKNPLAQTTCGCGQSFSI